MVNLFNYDEDIIKRFVDEFVSCVFPGEAASFTCIYRSADYAAERQVFLVAVNAARFALKLDLDSASSGRLEREYRILEELHAHFLKYKRVSSVKPVYLSPSGLFFVTDFVGRRTATDAIYNMSHDNRAGQVYRRAGEWLHALHDFRGSVQQRFWYQWMFETLKEITTETTPQASKADYAPMIENLRCSAEKLDGATDIKVFSHGDFHGRNLILDAGHTYGLDFTEANEKLAVYDIVDFLKADVFREGHRTEIDQSGVLKKNKQLFFKLYRHPINMEILDLCMRARLLIDWLAISKERHEKSNFQRTKFDRLNKRLEIAFDTSN